MSKYRDRRPGAGRSRSSGLLGVAAALAAVTVAATAAPGTARVSPAAASGAGAASTGVVGRPVATGAAAKRDFYDARQDPASAGVPAAARRAAAAVRPRAALQTLRAGLGQQAVVDLDPLTGTPRALGRLDGFLTGPSKEPAARIAMRYVTTHAAALGLTAADIATLRLRIDYVDIGGTHHLSWVQKAGAVTLFGNGLKAAVTKDGRLVMLQGAPVHAVSSLRPSASLSAAKARSAAVTDGGGTARQVAGTTAGLKTRFAGGDSATLVGFQTVGGTRLAWRTVTTPALGKGFVHVIDATTGRVLYRNSFSSHAAKPTAPKKPVGPTALVWENYPGAPTGGKAAVVDLGRKGWLARNAKTLKGPFAHVFTDVNGDDLAQRSEEVGPGRRSFQFPVTTFSVPGAFCTKLTPCTWDPRKRFSWNVNRRQNAVQVFYYVNKFHDHLLAAPIGFTRAAGNFDARDGDALVAQPMDAANTSLPPGLPVDAATDNANMATPPDGESPAMQMYLFHSPDDPTDPFVAGNGGDDASIVYHEYTHGLSHRLVVGPTGEDTLTTYQSVSMGEGWSDWYAQDFLVRTGARRDTAAPGEIDLSIYLGHGRNLIRSQPMDCPVGSTSPRCPGTKTAGRGGYTLADVGRVRELPEVHDGGEVWAQTLWDLRTAIGSTLAESLVTRAMELSPAGPSFLDMRNAILQADLVATGGRTQAKIWQTFARRGMGWFAADIGGETVDPAESFSGPPAKGTPLGILSGVIKDTDGKPLPGATVSFGGHGSGFPGDYASTTDSRGRYAISKMIPGTYAAVAVSKPGYTPLLESVVVLSGSTSQSWTLRRDWALVGSGTVLSSSNDVEIPGGECGPTGLIKPNEGWSTIPRLVDGKPGELFAVYKLAAPVDVSTIEIDPTATCGDDDSASAAGYALEVSSDGTTFTTVSSGRFDKTNLHRRNVFTVPAAAAKGVQYVRYTMKDNMVGLFGSCPSVELAGCTFVDSTSLSVFGDLAK